jgi:GLPGLI family protein
MKKNISVFIYLFFIASYSQKIEITDPIKITYSMVLNFEDVKYYNSTLKFNSEKAFFEWNLIENTPQTELQIQNDINTGKVSIDLTKDSEFFIFSNKNENILYEKKPELEEPFILKEPIETISWNKIDSTKTIGNFKCNLASSNFRGRKYFAWYSADIPTYWGPWKLQGLPGLILEVYDETQEIQIIVSEIKNVNNTFEKDIFGNNDVLNVPEWIEKKNNYRNNLKSKLFRNLPRSAKVSNFKIKEKKDFEVD